MSADNTTHHLITRASGATHCAYCKKSVADLGPNPTQQPCPAASEASVPPN